MNKIIKLIAVAMVFSAFLSSCYPDLKGTVEEYDIAITHYKSDQDFSSLSTFYIPDTVVYVGEEDKVLPILEHKYDAQILGEVSSNLESIGWTQIEDTSLVAEQADVTLFVTVLKTDVYSYVTYWYDYWSWYSWDWWYYSYDPYYYWYPGYSTGYYDYEYTSGTLLIEMLAVNDLDVDSEEEKTTITIPIIWTAGINGVLGASDEDILNRLSVQLKRAFDQSPYLKK